MFKFILNKLKQWTSFPSVRQPPQAIASAEAKLMVNINIAMALALYAVFGDVVVSIVAIGLFAFSIFVQKNTGAKKFINKRYVLLLISLACIALFLIRFHGSTGGRSWMGLLALLTSIKLLETNNLRDYFVAVILLYFFTAIIFAYHNSAIAPLFLALFSISTAAALMLLSSSNQLDENPNKQHKPHNKKA